MSASRESSQANRKIASKRNAMHRAGRIVTSGLLAGFAGEAVLGILFANPVTQAVLYNSNLQSPLFIEITARRNFAVSIGGLVVLSIIHAWLYTVFYESIPGTTRLRKGLFWGGTIWIMYWVFQEWFIYHTLLEEPLLLNAFELILLLVGSCVEGVALALLLTPKAGGGRPEDFNSPA
jgi:hypothetical protein